MKHPDQATLALHAGGDLGRFQAWRTARHAAHCTECRDEIASYQNVRALMPELGEIPELPWNRLAEEMRANIRLGLSAGECVREAAEAPRPVWLFNGARVAIALASVIAVLVTGVVLQHPTPSIMSGPAAVVQAMDYGIERRAGDRGFALMHKNVKVKDVAYTVGAQGTMGASYVDPSTGYVTMTKVYVE
jgi:hypothetical protein